MDYKQYNTNDFLKDEFFVQWVKLKKPEASHFWQTWLAANPPNKDQALAAMQIIRSVMYKHNPTPTEQTYRDVLEGIYQHESNRYALLEAPRPWYWSTLKIAASIAFLLISGLVFFLLYQHNLIKETPQKVVKYTKQSPLGVKTTFMLNDGSKIMLNSGSRLTYDNNFGEGDRRVTLEGEAFFEVTEDSLSPFIVQTPHLNARVLGTSFNVSAYADEKKVQVAVYTGKVAVSHRLAPIEHNVSKNQLITFQNNDFHPKLEVLDYNTVIGWKEGIIVFNESTFEEVSAKLSRWFDVKFVMKQPKRINGRFTGEFDNKTLEDIMRGLSFASGFQYEIDGKEVIIR
jgi:ferric-dicitrate binding protein FerR (iron transport regulator)